MPTYSPITPDRHTTTPGEGLTAASKGFFMAELDGSHTFHQTCSFGRGALRARASFSGPVTTRGTRLHRESATCIVYQEIPEYNHGDDVVNVHIIHHPQSLDSIPPPQRKQKGPTVHDRDDRSQPMAFERRTVFTTVFRISQ
jgi:hypothetical protein